MLGHTHRSRIPQRRLQVRQRAPLHGRGALVAVGLLGLGLMLATFRAEAQVPSQVPFQGLLLDAGGAPLNDSVDLDFALFDALSAGNNLWSESHLGVIVVDGVYSVNLGEATPITQAVLGGGAAFLEITVSGETLVPRQQLLAVPYALVADSVGSVSAQFVEQVATHFSFDGQEPGNFHPDEGTVDSDGDGIPNFLDPDNDDDGRLDALELAEGTSLNVFGPTVSTVSPGSIPSFADTTLNVTGLGFDTLASVSFAGETPVPSGLTSTSFSVAVTAPTFASSELLTVTLANGESASRAVGVAPVAPTITKVVPGVVPANASNELLITGTGFFAGTTVQIASQSLTPTTLSATFMVVTMAPEPEGPTTLSVLHPNGLSASRPLEVVGPSSKFVFVTSTSYTGGFGSTGFADSVCGIQAALGSLPGTYRAWMSDGASSPATTFAQNLGPYYRPSGLLVANDWADLTDGTLVRSISETATGIGVGSSFAWTGTASDGTAIPSGASATCNDWTPSGVTGVGGSTSSNAGSWTNTGSAFVCGVTARFYCFQE